MPNRLASESSPYLLQHAGNPVDWHPWGAEALAAAKSADKPIFLSIGYAACHWCHVMEHESFENPSLARLMNDYFINIKIDREERPDLDQIYMQAVQMLTGRGGWPMSVFLTPDLQPFYGGTYFPPTGRQGLPGFDQILNAVHEAWQKRRELVVAQAAELTKLIQKDATAQALTDEKGELAPDLMAGAADAIERSFDHQHGGFGGAPKFPHPMDIRLLLRLSQRLGKERYRDMAALTLDKMAAGGIYDHLGGGFHRYSVDERWLVPHFEKMLYDNALLTSAYVEAFVATGNADYARVARETCDYVLRDMTDEAGGFQGTEDADSEGEEGKFYVWTPKELAEVLGDDAAETFCYVYDVSGPGNFEGHNILNLPKTIEQCAKVKRRDIDELRKELAESRTKLLAVRNKRVRPGKDDKVLANWNGLMIEAMADAAGALDELRYLDAATRAADFVLKSMRRPDGRLWHSWRGGRAKGEGHLDDYAALANALVSLYEAGFEERFIDEAVKLAEIMLARFRDPAHGGFFYTADDHEALIARPREFQDTSVPSGNSLAATALVRLGKLSGRSDFLDAAAGTLRAALPLLRQSPSAAGQSLLALGLYLGPTPELVFVGDRQKPEGRDVLKALCRTYLPNTVMAWRGSATDPAASRSLDELFAGKQTNGPLMLYLCENFTCQEPVSGLAAITSALRKLAEARP